MTDDVHNVADDTQTQRLRRPATPAWPGPLDQTRAAQPAPETPETEVLSIHDLMEPGPVAAEPALAETAIVEPAPVEAPVDAVPVDAVPADAVPADAMSGPAAGATYDDTPAPTVDVRHRLRTDSAAALSGARRGAEDWLRAGDHGLAVATAVMTVLLLIVVAVVG